MSYTPGKRIVLPKYIPIIHDVYGVMAMGNPGFVAGSTVAFSPGANVTHYYPVFAPHQIVVQKIALPISATPGNFDVGLYDASGNRLVSSGSTAMTTGLTEVDITDTVIGPGRYYLAVAADTATSWLLRYTMTAAQAPALGLARESVFPLPATATFSAWTTDISIGAVALMPAQYVP